jgi:lysylphosphatidylglycerol synthetase-like protein (DUF2156 family)
MWLGRFYWQAAKRWPVLHALGCCLGLIVGLGMLLLFLDPQPNERPAVAGRLLSVFVLVGYGWFFGAFLLRLKRGTWSSHCDSQILFFSGIDSSTKKLVASAKSASDLHFTSNQILLASLINLALTILLFVAERLRWHDQFMAIPFSLGLLCHPILGYIAVRKMTETGFSWRWFFSAVLCSLGVFLWALTFYYLLRRWD